jgi:hypothetical protein
MISRQRGLIIDLYKPKEVERSEKFLRNFNIYIFDHAQQG